MFSRKYRIHAFLFLLFLAIIIYPQYSNRPDDNKTTAATASALDFLKLVDAGKFDDSWHIAAGYLRTTVPLADWQQKMAALRKASGPIIERAQSSAEFTAPAKELPDTDVIMVTFDSKFEQHQDAQERVTLMLSKESGWQVVGYFIK